MKMASRPPTGPGPPRWSVARGLLRGSVHRLGVAPVKGRAARQGGVGERRAAPTPQRAERGAGEGEVPGAVKPQVLSLSRWYPSEVTVPMPAQSPPVLRATIVSLSVGC